MLVKKGIAITKSLTATRMKKLKEVREIYDFKNVWTSDAKILLKDGPGNIIVYFMINPDLVGDRQGLHYGKRNTFCNFIFIFGYMWGCV